MSMQKQLSGTEIKSLYEFACGLADRSGAVIREYYRNYGAISSKQDLSPVTIADQEAEQVIRALIAKHYPSHAIIGEEYGALDNDNLTAKDSDFRWVIDPIDGTASFMIGRPIFGTLIALLYKNQPIIGIIDQPITGERWAGVKNLGAFFGQNNKIPNVKINVAARKSLKDAILCTTGPQYFNNEKLAKFNNLTKNVRYTIYGGDCYNYSLLAMGMVDAVVESGLKLHDFMALKIIVEEAGGVVSDWQGRELDSDSGGDVVFAASRDLCNEILTSIE